MTVSVTTAQHSMEHAVSAYGFELSEFDILAGNAHKTIGGLFTANSCEMSHEKWVEIFRKLYR
jgi:alcohol dehydrogenase